MSMKSFLRPVFAVYDANSVSLFPLPWVYLYYKMSEQDQRLSFLWHWGMTVQDEWYSAR